MSWQERKKIHEQKTAAEAARQIMEQRLKELSIHPLLKENCSRDFCDAFFHGLVFAAFADNERLDKDERAVLNDIGTSLGMSKYDVDEVVDAVQAVVDDVDKFEALIDECMSTIKANESAVKLFYAEFVQVWFSSAGNRDNSPDGALVDLVKKTGVVLPVAKQHSIKEVLKGGDDLDANLLGLAEWMGDDALKFFVVKKYGDVTERLAAERNRKRRRLERKKKELLKKAERIKFAAVIEQMSEAHKLEGSLHVGWDNELKEGLSDFRADDIDWSEECKLRLTALNRIPHCYAKLVYNGQERPRRKIVWKLMCMLFVFGGTVRQNEIDDLLRSATQLSTEGYRKRIENFIAQHFNVGGGRSPSESDTGIKLRFVK